MPTEPLLERTASESDPSEELREEIARAEEKAELLARANVELGGAPLAGSVEAAQKETASLGSAYRDVDPRSQLEETLEDVNDRVVNLALENAVLADRLARKRLQRRVLWIRVLALVALLATVGGIALLASPAGFGLLIWIAAVTGLGAVVYVLTGRITPNTSAPKQSPYTGMGR